MAVTRCVCREVAFTAVVIEAARLRAAGLSVSLEALGAATGAGTGCGTCRPYLARAAIAGQAVQPVMGPEEQDRWLGALRGQGALGASQRA